MEDKEKLVELINDAIYWSVMHGAEDKLDTVYEFHIQSIIKLAEYLEVGFKRKDCKKPLSDKYTRVIFLTTEGRIKDE